MAAINNPNITQAWLKERLHYNPETGVFTWVTHRHSNMVNARAGYLDTKTGYRRIMFKNSVLKAIVAEHRLAWFYTHGVWPEATIDHRDGVKDNNKLCNLRPATILQNNTARPAPKNNTVGFKGVQRVARRGKVTFRAQVHVGGKSVYTGHFKAPEDASVAYGLQAKKYFGEFAHQ